MSGFYIPAANIESELVTGQYSTNHKREKRVFYIVRWLDLNGHHLVLFKNPCISGSHRSIAVLGLSSDSMVSIILKDSTRYGSAVTIIDRTMHCTS